MHVQYRNSLYFGSFKDYQREGYGLLVLDNSNIIMAKWSKGLVNGNYAFAADKVRAFGTMANNKLQGFNIISTRDSIISMKSQSQKTIYGMFRENKPYGKCIIIDNDMLILAYFTNGQLKETLQKKPLKDRDMKELLSSLFPKYMYSLEEYLIEIFKEASRQIQSEESLCKYQPTITQYEDGYKYYGYNEVYEPNKGFGFVILNNEVISVGEHVEDFLQGLGRSYKNNTVIEDGVFRNGELCGIGISYTKNGHKYTLGEHGGDNKAFEKGFGFPQKQISEIRKQFHLRSIYFYNDIVLLPIATLVQALIQNSLKFNQPIDNSSPRFSSIKNNKSRRGFAEKSPVRAKLDKFEYESDHIDDPSPLREPNDDYRPVEQRPSKYFQSEKSEPGEFQFDDRSKKSYDKKYGQIRKDPSHGGKKSTNLRDTKDLVRELDEKQKTRRNYLDQIYKQAKIYQNRK